MSDRERTQDMIAAADKKRLTYRPSKRRSDAPALVGVS
jgi:hypothetical protein